MKNKTLAVRVDWNRIEKRRACLAKFDGLWSMAFAFARSGASKNFLELESAKGSSLHFEDFRDNHTKKILL